MLTLEQINQQLIGMAEATRAEIAFDLSTRANFADFYLLRLKKETILEAQLTFNLYKPVYQ